MPHLFSFGLGDMCGLQNSQMLLSTGSPLNKATCSGVLDINACFLGCKSEHCVPVIVVSKYKGMKEVYTDPYKCLVSSVFT